MPPGDLGYDRGIPEYPDLTGEVAGRLRCRSSRDRSRGIPWCVVAMVTASVVRFNQSVERLLLLWRWLINGSLLPKRCDTLTKFDCRGGAEPALCAPTELTPPAPPVLVTPASQTIKYFLKSYDFLTRYMGIIWLKMVEFGRFTHEMTSTE